MTGSPLFYAACSILFPAGLTLLVLVYRVVTRNRIDRFSVKEAIDRLPMGLIVYRPDGLVLLANETMGRFALRTTGKPLMNAADFHLKLFEAAEELLQEEGVEADRFLFRDGPAMIAVGRKEMEIEGERLFQLTAYDITELYERERELKGQVDHLQEASDRLKGFEQQVDALAKQEAYLSTKERIHDSLGQVLLSTRYYLTEPDAQVTAQTLFSLWEETIDGLMSATGKEAQPAPERGILNPLEEAAKALGARLIVEGSFPAGDIRLTRLVVFSARVCIINAVRHGGATEVTLSFGENRDRGEYVFRLSNNGHPPGDNMQEGGGLKSLRINVEKEGGRVSYETKPHFTVTVCVPVTAGDS